MGKIVFEHGPSGAGKGILGKVATKIYEDTEHRVICTSSGDLFRAASDASVNATMEKGAWVKTLGKILPGLKDVYREHLKNDLSTDGKSALILDGFLRATTIDDEGVIIPPQLEQIAQAMLEVRQEEGRESDLTLGDVIAELKSAEHVLIDVAPEDAIAQIRSRAKTEVESIKDQLVYRFTLGLYSAGVLAFSLALTQKLQEWVEDDGSDRELSRKMSKEAAALRSEMADVHKLSDQNVYSDFFAQLGIVTNLRNDDLPLESVEGRVAKYVHRDGDEYTLGDAGHALADDVGYIFDPRTGRFSSDHPNLVVIQNGRSRGVELDRFKSLCEEFAHSSIEGAHSGVDGQPIPSNRKEK